MDSLGTYLRYERELRQISLEEISQTTRIPLRMLQRIESDDFEHLPGEVFVRGFLKAYATSVGLSPDDVIERYSKRHDSDSSSDAPAQDVPPAPITALETTRSGRRFGIAIALVILLILFTLALSIAMRPRRRDTPIELSTVEQVVSAPVRTV